MENDRIQLALRRGPLLIESLVLTFLITNRITLKTL